LRSKHRDQVLDVGLGPEAPASTKGGELPFAAPCTEVCYADFASVHCGCVKVCFLKISAHNHSE
jgi:hypothetical protein